MMSITLVLSDTSRDLTIGSATTSWHFNGLLDEVVILSAELDEDDLQYIMNEGLERASGLAPVESSGKLTTTWAGIKK